MKKFLFALLLIPQLFLAQTAFDKGNALYRKGDFNGAVKEYELVMRSKKESAELYFNLGNAYYKLNQVAPSIYYYEKAKLLAPDDADISNNLKFAQKLQIDEVKDVPKVGFRKMIEDFTSILSFDGWAWVAVLSAFAVLALFCGYYFSGLTLAKRIFFIGMFVFIFVSAASIFAAIFEKGVRAAERPAIVFSGVVGVKSEPQKEAEDAFLLHEGAKVYVLESLDNWDKIELPDGNQGWIEKSAIKELK